MLYYEFWSVFPKISPKGSNLVHWNLLLSLRFKFGNSRFWTHARAEWLALEREIRASSTLHCFTVRSSGVLDARARTCVTRSSGYRAPNRAWFSPIQYFWHVLQTAQAGRFTLKRSILFACTLERVNTRSSRTPVFWKLVECFKRVSLHPHFILGILRPSLRHLNEDFDVKPHWVKIGIKLLFF